VIPGLSVGMGFPWKNMRFVPWDERDLFREIPFLYARNTVSIRCRGSMPWRSDMRL